VFRGRYSEDTVGELKKEPKKLLINPAIIEATKEEAELIE